MSANFKLQLEPGNTSVKIFFIGVMLWARMVAVPKKQIALRIC